MPVSRLLVSRCGHGLGASDALDSCLSRRPVVSNLLSAHQLDSGFQRSDSIRHQGRSRDAERAALEHGLTLAQKGVELGFGPIQLLDVHPGDHPIPRLPHTAYLWLCQAEVAPQ